jgi:hypothetical protein
MTLTDQTVYYATHIKVREYRPQCCGTLTTGLSKIHIVINENGIQYSHTCFSDHLY